MYIQHTILRKSSPIILVTICSAIVAAFILVMSSPAAQATTASEERGCNGYNSGKAYLLYNSKGKSYRGEGFLRITTKKVKGKVRTCAYTQTPNGKKTYMSVQLGTRAKNGSKVKWSTNPNHVDSGTVTSYAGGVAATASKGRCVVVRGFMIKADDKYSKKVANANTCN